MATNRDSLAEDGSYSDDFQDRIREFLPFSSRVQSQEPSSSSYSSMHAKTSDSDQDFSSDLQLQDARAVSPAFQSLFLSAADASLHGPSGEGPSRTEKESSSSEAVSVSASTSYQPYDSAEVFRLYFKGLVEGEKAGIGVAICDPRGESIFHARKPLVGDWKNRAADIAALIEGLKAAQTLGLKRVLLCCDSPTTHKFISRRWISKQRKVALLIDQATSLRKNFVLCYSRLRSRKEINHAIKFAREAIKPPVENQHSETSGLKNSPTETCAICYEDKKVNEIFSVKPCGHRYCVSCMRQHVEYRLRIPLSPNCPHENCKSKLNFSSCKVFLTPEFLDIMHQRQREAMIPVWDRVYCPNPRCSFLMSRAKVSKHLRKYRVKVELSFARKCVKCKGWFCLSCKVPWHGGMNCEDYRGVNPNHDADDTKLKLLASANLWSQCKNCNLIIEFTGGCYHMTCRCGYEFCYKCEAEWKDGKATCSCPLWDKRNIVEEEDWDDDEFDEYFDEEDYDDYGYDYESEEEQFCYSDDFCIYTS